MLNNGQRLGPYEILRALGAGGMGEVYRARDPRLGREVAVKILPAEFAVNPERMIRFEQEARSASALNHPNIITIYDIGSINSTAYIVMELVDGKSLRETLAAGPIPLRKTVSIAAQLADGLAKAHAAGIVHRDLKPENIMITKDGYCKILDFGLAKLTAPADDQASDLPTQTGPGTILGTIAYMSPEQAGAKPLDFRSDQFSFGSILYEMIAGKRAFSGKTAVETMSVIIQTEPEPIQCPPAFRWIIERCLAKDREERYESTRDLARDLKSIRDHFSEISTSMETTGFQKSANKSWQKIFNIAAVLTVVGLVSVLFLKRPAIVEPPAVRFLTYSGHDRTPAVSPDGKIIAFTSERDGKRRIWLKQFPAGNETVLTTGPDDHARFSPDGSMLLFVRADGTKLSLYRVPLLGGEPRKMIDHAESGDWSPDGKSIAFIRPGLDESNPLSILFVSDTNGKNLHELARFRKGALKSPRWSPDGKKIAVIGLIQGTLPSEILWIDVNSKITHLISPPRALGILSGVIWSGRKDEVIYSQLENLVTIPGLSEGRVLSQNIKTGTSKTLFWNPNFLIDPQNNQFTTLDILANGNLVFDSSFSRQNLQERGIDPQNVSESTQWISRGNSVDRQPTYSPDGQWILFSSSRGGNLDLWKNSRKSGSLLRLTDDTAQDWDPVFTPDGKNILWSSNRGGHFEVWSASADGNDPRQITQDGVDAENPAVTPDGEWIVYNSYNSAKSGIWIIRKDGTGARRLIQGATEFPEVSPDGQYVAHANIPVLGSRLMSFRFVRVVRISDGAVVLKIPVKSNVIAGRTRWLPDGKRIAFIDQDEENHVVLYVQDFTPGKDSSVTRKPLVPVDPDLKFDTFGISPDGSRVTLSVVETLNSLMIAENVPDVLPQIRK